MPKQDRVVYSTEPESDPKPKARAESAPSARQGTLYVERDRKGRRGKTVTVISGLQGSDADREALLKQFKALCGAGGTLKDGNLEIQGDHRDKLLARLKEMGYQAKQKGG